MHFNCKGEKLSKWLAFLFRKTTVLVSKSTSSLSLSSYCKSKNYTENRRRRCNRIDEDVYVSKTKRVQNWPSNTSESKVFAQHQLVLTVRHKWERKEVTKQLCHIKKRFLLDLQSLKICNFCEWAYLREEERLPSKDTLVDIRPTISVVRLSFIPDTFSRYTRLVSFAFPNRGRWGGGGCRRTASFSSIAWSLLGREKCEANLTDSLLTSQRWHCFLCIYDRSRKLYFCV